MALIDTHCHLADPRLLPDLEGIIHRASAAGVAHLLSVGAIGSIETDRTTVAIAERYSDVYAAVGIHPHNASDCDQKRLDELEQLARSKKVMAIGESGMDLYYTHSPRDAQEHSLREHLRLAQKLALPIIIHCRNAESEVDRIVREEGMPSAGGVIHCFTGDAAAVLRFLELGFHISFSGIVTFKNAGALRETVGLVPEDRLLVETDAPFLTPEPYRGKRNEPAFVTFTAATLAALRNISPAQINEQLLRNVALLFRIPVSTEE